MRRIPLLLALLLLLVSGTATSAQALLPPSPIQPAPILLLEEEEEEEGEGEEPAAEEEEEEEETEPEEEESCEPDPELEESCEGETPRQGEGECLLKKASATVTANPGKRRLRLSVHYRMAEPASVVVETGLHSPRGALHLGTEHARFRRSGVYRDTFALPQPRMRKALAAREFEVALRVVGTPPSCRVELVAHRDGSRKLAWS